MNNTKKERLFYLDFIRAISLIFVIINHFNFHLALEKIKGAKILRFFPDDYFAYIGVSLYIIISGAALMYTYQDKLKIKEFFKKRFFSIYPTFWTGYVIAFLFTFYMNKSINHSVPKWTFILSVVGMDGYLSQKIPNYYLVGEWFLGFIILFYLIFPLLRSLVIKFPKSLIIFTLISYYITIHYRNGAYTNVLGRLPEFIFGVYFVYYLKKVKLYQVILALFIDIFIIFTKLNINLQYKVTIVGISSFIILVYIAEKVKIEQIKNIISFISKYSFSSILANQFVMLYVMINFTGRAITEVESYLLFMIVYFIITIIAVFISKTSNKLIQYFKQVTMVGKNIIRVGTGTKYPL